MKFIATIMACLLIFCARPMKDADIKITINIYNGLCFGGLIEEVAFREEGNFADPEKTIKMDFIKRIVFTNNMALCFFNSGSKHNAFKDGQGVFQLSWAPPKFEYSTEKRIVKSIYENHYQIFTYNEKGLVGTVTSYSHGDKSILTKESYFYNEKGEIIRKLVTSERGSSIYYFNPRGDVVSIKDSIYRTENSYSDFDSHGNWRRRDTVIYQKSDGSIQKTVLFRTIIYRKKN